MVNRSYHDFDMAIMDRGDGRYDVRVLDSPSGQARCEFTLPFSDLELENFLLRIGRSRRGVRRLESPEAQAARAFGERLSEAIFTGDVGVAWQRSVDDAEREGKGLRLRLRLTDAEVLTEVPWEFLCVPSSKQHLVLSSWTPLVRYLDLPRSPRPLTVNPPLRMLAMVSSPTDYPALDTESEWSKLDESLEPLESAGIVEVTRVDEATLQGLQRALRRTDYHVFHFIGHGGFDEQASEGVLVLEDEHGRSRHVTAHELGTILTDARSIRLAVLNSCEGARAGGADPFGGTAPTLVRGGIPAVVAMQFEITDRAAIVFAHELYAAISDGYPVDAAVAEARRAIFGAGNDVEWGTPVLYMRTDDGRLFDFAPSSTQAPSIEPQESAAAETEPDDPPPPEQIQADPDLAQETANGAADVPSPEQPAVVDLTDEESVPREDTDVRVDQSPPMVTEPIVEAPVDAVAEAPMSEPGGGSVAVEPVGDSTETSLTVELDEFESATPVAPHIEEIDPPASEPGASEEVALVDESIVEPDEPVLIDEIESAAATSLAPLIEEIDAPLPEPAASEEVTQVDQLIIEPDEHAPVDESPRTDTETTPPKRTTNRTLAAVGAVAGAIALVATIQAVAGSPEDSVNTTLGATAATIANADGAVVEDGAVVAVQAPAIIIDGDLSDWADVPVAVVAQHRIAGQTPAEERLGADSTASFRIAYDDFGLYIAGEVDDDTVLNENFGDQIWRGDAINLNLSTVAPDLASATPDSDDFQITLTPADGNGVAAHALFQGVGASTFRGAETDTAISMESIAQDSAPYTVEAFVPWSLLGLGGPPGDDLTALFTVFDNDGESDGKQPLQAVVLAHLDGARFQEPNTWGRLILQP